MQEKRKSERVEEVEERGRRKSGKSEEERE